MNAEVMNAHESTLLHKSGHEVKLWENEKEEVYSDDDEELLAIVQEIESNFGDYDGDQFLADK